MPASPSSHGSGAPSAWVTRWAATLAPSAEVMDLACGAGRHVRWLAAQGLRVSAVDRDAAALADLRGLPGVAEVVEADIEQGPWPLPGRQFDAIVVTNYLWRPLWPRILASLRPGGRLIYETFNIDHALIGRPSNPAFLLRHGELLELCQGLRVLGYEDGFLSPPDRQVQRISALSPDDGLAMSSAGQRHPL
jgi:SAM-dependent methyltransferase